LSKLDKSTTSIVLNTVEGNGRFSGTDQAKFLGIAYRATVQSATLVDLTTVDSCPADPSPVEEGRDLLRRIAAMLRQLSKAVRDDI
jgi:four helix bundle protein